MSHLRKGAGGDSGTHGRSVGPRKSDNAVAASVSPNTKACRSRSKNKIPKAVRYDLENALLSLCDVWFDEIKPHLVANGIKLHVHGGEASGDHAAPGTCPHLHPGAASDHLRRQNVSFAGCYPTQRPASIAQSRKLPVPTAPQSLQHLEPLATPQKTQNHHHSYEKTSKRFRVHRKRRTAPVAAQQLQWRVPRLCRTYSLLPTVSTQSPILTKRTYLQQRSPPSRLDNHIKAKLKRNKTIKGNHTRTLNLDDERDENKNQTKSILSPQRMRFAVRNTQPTSPNVLTSLVKRNSANSQITQDSKVALSTKRKLFRDLSTTTMVLQRTRPGTYRVASQLEPELLENKGLDHTKIHRSKHHRQTAMKTERIVGTSKGNGEVIESAIDSKCNKPIPTVELKQKPVGRNRGTAMLCESSRSRSRPIFADNETDFFREDLINIIHEKRDKRLKILYNGVERDDMPSMMNLLPSPARLKTAAVIKPPWK